MKIRQTQITFTNPGLPIDFPWGPVTKQAAANIIGTLFAPSTNAVPVRRKIVSAEEYQKQRNAACLRFVDQLVRQGLLEKVGDDFYRRVLPKSQVNILVDGSWEVHDQHSKDVQERTRYARLRNTAARAEEIESLKTRIKALENG